MRTVLKGYKQGVDENAELKSMLDAAAREVHELMNSERPDTFPYSYKECASPIEYYSRDGFIAASYNLGGIRIRAFDTVPMIEGSGMYPSSEHADKEIRRMGEYNYQLACEQHGIDPKSELTDEQRELVYETANEIGSDDTIMFEVCIMYHGVDARGVHSATIQTVVNTECPYHRSSISWMPGLKCEDYIETEITWRSHARAKDKIIRAAKAGIKKLF